jgi:hypothetical protein
MRVQVFMGRGFFLACHLHKKVKDTKERRTKPNM